MADDIPQCKKVTLYELAQKLREQTEAFDPETGEVGEPAAYDLAEYDFMTKIEACAVVRRELKGRVEECRALVKHYRERQAAMEADVGRLENYVKTCLEVAGQQKVTTGTATVWLQRSLTVPDQDFDHTKLDPKYVRVKTTYELEKRAIKADYEAGVETGVAVEVGQDVRFR